MSGIGDDEQRQADEAQLPYFAQQHAVSEGTSGHVSMGDFYHGQPPRLFVCINAARVGPARESSVTGPFASNRATAAPATFGGELLSVAGVPVVTAILDHLADSLENHHASEAWKTCAYDTKLFPPEPPPGSEEAWARLVAEKFAGIAYMGPDILANFVGSHAGDGATYLYTRFQATTRPWTPMPRPGSTQLRLGLDLNTPGRPNPDPAYSLAAACEYVSTYVALSRGFSIEDRMLAAPFPCSQQISQMPIFKEENGGAWFPTQKYLVKDDPSSATTDGTGKGLNKAAAAINVSPPMAEGTVFVRNPNDYQYSRWVHVTDAEADALDNGSPAAKNSAGLGVQTRDAAVASDQGVPDGQWDGNIPPRASHDGMVDLARDLSKVYLFNGTRTTERQIRLLAQDPGSHIRSVLRTYNHPERGQVAQMFETVFHVESQKPEVHHPFHLTEPTSFKGTYDGDAITDLEDGHFVGMGVLPPPGNLPGAIESLGRSRPVGLFRIVIIARREANTKAWDFLVSAKNILYVSPMMRMYGDSNHSILRRRSCSGPCAIRPITAPRRPISSPTVRAETWRTRCGRKWRAATGSPS